jgi:hypothetical protein
MRRTASMLGVALATLALAASPAWAVTPAQSTDDSTGAAQVGPVGVNAPVRVASDGDDEAAAQGGSAGGQSTTGSEGAAQVGSVAVEAPVRIASDGENRGAARPEGGSQGVDDSTGAAQVGPVGVNAPVRVLSKGNNEPAGAGGPGSDGGGGGGGLSGRRGGGLPPGDTPDEGPSEHPTGLTHPKSSGVQAPEAETEASGGGLASVSTPNGSGPVAAASARQGELPFTGLTVWMLLAMGAFALASGLRLQRRFMLEGRTRSM